ncbi:MAG: cell division protein ZipA [Psychromonas sp.]
MQHFQSILIVIGVLAIGAVLVHGYLLSRKEKKAASENLTEPTMTVDMFAEKTSPATELLTDGVISDVRIISHKEETEIVDIDFSEILNDEKEDNINFNNSDFDTIAPLGQVSAKALQTDNDPLKNEADQPSDLFIFNVTAKEGKLLGGHELLQFFLTSGFRFGEMSIFHRHENPDGTGPVLFSIANMMAPGVFDPEYMEQFKSEGVSFFLTAPNKDINIKSSFDLMLRAVEQMAEEFDCEVLNADRKRMTEEQFIEYNSRLLHYI